MPVPPLPGPRSSLPLARVGEAAALVGLGRKCSFQKIKQPGISRISQHIEGTQPGSWLWKRATEQVQSQVIKAQYVLRDALLQASFFQAFIRKYFSGLFSSFEISELVCS